VFDLTPLTSNFKFGLISFVNLQSWNMYLILKGRWSSFVSHHSAYGFLLLQMNECTCLVYVFGGFEKK
jgi:hypothetical protein